MSAQLADPRPSAQAFEYADRGIGLLLRFTGGISVMVADVVVIGAVGRFWVLIPGFAVLLITAAVIFTGIMRLLQDGAEEDPS